MLVLGAAWASAISFTTLLFLVWFFIGLLPSSDLLANSGLLVFDTMLLVKHLASR